MRDSTWQRLPAILHGLGENERGALAAAMRVPAGDAGVQYLLDILTEVQNIRLAIRTLPDRAAKTLGRAIHDGGRPLEPGQPVLKTLVAAGLVLPTPAGYVPPLEFAFAAESLLPEESLLRLIAHGRPEELRRWLERLLNIISLMIGSDAEAGIGLHHHELPGWLILAADLYTVIVSYQDELLQSLSGREWEALQAFGPLEGMMRRREFLERFAPEEAATEHALTPWHTGLAMTGAAETLIIRGMLAASDTSWQPTRYLHIPLEWRQTALKPFLEQRREQTAAVLAQAKTASYQPSGQVISAEGPELLKYFCGVLACAPLRLTQKEALLQQDLERVSGLLGISARQTEALADLALDLGLATVQKEQMVLSAQESWPHCPLSTRGAVRIMGQGRDTGHTSGGTNRDFLSFLRLSLLEALVPTDNWLTAAQIKSLLLTAPGIGRWLEFYWNGSAQDAPFTAAVNEICGPLTLIGALETEPNTGAGLRAARLLPWGRALLAPEVTLQWPPDGELTVAANHEIYTPLGMGPAALSRLGRFTELTGAGPTMIFRISVESMRRAANTGVDIAGELAWFSGMVPGGLPENVRRNILETAGRQGEIELGEAGGFLRIKDPTLLDTVKHLAQAANQLILAEASDLLVLAPGSDLARLKGSLQKAGLLVTQVRVWRKEDEGKSGKKGKTR